MKPLFAHVRVGAQSQQHFDDTSMFACSSRVDGCGLEPVVGRGIDLRTGPGEIFGSVVMSEIACQPQRLEPILGVGVDELRVTCQQANDVVDLTCGRSFEDR